MKDKETFKLINEATNTLKNNLPQGWEIKKLGEVCSLLNRGISPKYLEAGGVCVLNQKCIRDHLISFEQSRLHDSLTKPVSPEKFIKLGDVLVNSTGNGTLGRVAQVRKIPKELVTIDSHVTIVRPKEGMFFSDFFGYMLILIEESIKEAGEGCGGQTELARSVLSEKFIVQYPRSIQEQKCIAAILDETFDNIAKAKVNAEQNLNNAKELFDSYLQSVFANNSKGWEEIKLGEIAKVVGGYSFKSTDFKKQGKYQVLRMGNVRPGYIRPNENPVFIDYLDDKVREKALLKLNDVIITQTGTNKKRDYGFTVIIEKENYLLNQRIAVIRFPSSLLPKFFLYFSWTNLFKDQFFANETGTVGQGNVGITAITDAKIPFPKLAQQLTIVHKLEELSNDCKKLESIYQKKVIALDELKKSILQKAFSGQLS